MFYSKTKHDRKSTKRDCWIIKPEMTTSHRQQLLLTQSIYFDIKIYIKILHCLGHEQLLAKKNSVK